KLMKTDCGDILISNSRKIEIKRIAFSFIPIILFLMFYFLFISSGPVTAHDTYKYTGILKEVSAGESDETPKAGKETHSAANYVTLNKGEELDLSFVKKSLGSDGASLSLSENASLFERKQKSYVLKAARAGYTRVSISAPGFKKNIYCFISPLPSKHAGRNDINWYKTQYGTGRGNCGPALISMAILWSKGVDVSVNSIRGEIGYPSPDGAINFEDMKNSLRRHQVHFSEASIDSIDDLIRIITNDRLALVLLNSGMIEEVKGDPRYNLFGRYYEDAGGHYILLKGYSFDKNYFIVYDPMPGDWAGNTMRYADGFSMIGANRYYSSSNLFNALKTVNVLEIYRDF
ncbi:MAG: C39 family peptidase, partial [Spirochaetota bacterium]